MNKKLNHRIDSVIDMGKDPELMTRRVKTNDGRIALEIVTSGHIGVLGSSMNSFYITTTQNFVAGCLGLPFAPHADNLGIEG
jgi:hypothetical protein